ncbi:MAG: hypothetical protein AB7P69_21695 [Candidatus Binatia bacterium]
MSFSTVSARHDMVWFVTVKCSPLRQQAILTPRHSTFGNQLA